jgi:hypothetical protein
MGRTCDVYFPSCVPVYTVRLEGCMINNYPSMYIIFTSEFTVMLHLSDIASTFLMVTMLVIVKV